MTGSGASSVGGFTGPPRLLRDHAPVRGTVGILERHGAGDDAEPEGGGEATDLVHVPKAASAPEPGAPAPRWTLPGGLSKPSRILPLVAAALALAIGAVVVGGQGSDGPAPGEAIVDVDGLAIVHRAGGGSERVEDRTRLEPGDRLTLERGSAALELNDDVAFAALAARGDTPATELRMGRTPRLLAGPLLVTAPRATELLAGDGRVRLSDASAARITRTLASRVDVYRGRATLDSAGATQAVPTLRSAEVVAEGDLTGTRPLTYAADHPWDRRFLGPALSLDRELEPLAVGMEASGLDADQLADRLRGQLDGAPSVSRLRALLSDREAPLDAAIGLAVVGTGRDRSFDQRWADGFRFHDAGAPWGLVALDLGADPDAVIDALTAAIDTTAPGDGAEELAAGPGAGTTPTSTAPGTAAGATTGPGAEGATTGEADPAAGGGPAGGGGTPAGGTTPSAGGSSGPGVSAPPVTVPNVSVPGVTVPPVTLPPIPVVTTIVQSLNPVTGPVTSVVGPIVAPVVCTPGLGPVTGGGGLLGGVTGTGGLLPICP